MSPLKPLQMSNTNTMDTSNTTTTNSSSRPFTVVVEGNIGSGKSTFLQHFSKHFSQEVEVLTEPVAKWQDVNGHNLLQLMYEDPSRWSLTFQSYVLLTMVQEHVKKTKTPIKMMERSVYSARNCFVENLHRSGKMPDSEKSVYNEWYNFLRKNDKTKKELGVDLIVYLRTDPEIAHARVKSRARSEESVIPIEYLRELHDLHENWLMGKENNDDELPARVLVIDANEDLTINPEMFSQHEEGILSSVRQQGGSGSVQASPKKLAKAF